MTLLAKRQERSIVPRMYYITTAIDYTNGPPHIGHAYEKVLADVLARWHRMKGEEVYFLTGESAMTDGPPRRIRATRPACRKS